MHPLLSRLLCMIAALLLLPAAFAGAAPATQPNASDTTTTSSLVYTFPKPGEIKLIDQDKEIDTILAHHGSELLVVNFWATFCAPCVEELPYFVELSKKYPEKKVRVVGFSVDQKRMIDSDVIPFLKKKQIPYANFLIFTDPEKTINSFAPEWGGDIPVTFLYDRNGKQLEKFLRPVTAEELNTAVEKHLKK